MIDPTWLAFWLFVAILLVLLWIDREQTTNLVRRGIPEVNRVIRWFMVGYGNASEGGVPGVRLYFRWCFGLLAGWILLVVAAVVPAWLGVVVLGACCAGQAWFVTSNYSKGIRP